jgi:hypothetical protein
MSKPRNHRQVQSIPRCRTPTLIAAAGAISLPALAFQPLITDDTGTQGAGGNQLEAGYSRVAIGADRERSAGFAFTRGITDALDGFVETAHVGTEPAGGPVTSGWSNVALGAKWRFLECGECQYSVAFKPVVVLPVGQQDETDGLGSGKISWEATLIGTMEFGWGALHANALIGRERFKDQANGPDADNWQLSLAPAVQLGEQWLVAADLGVGESEATDGSGTTETTFAEIGTVFAPNEDLELALGVIRARSELAGVRAYATEITAGVTWRFK